MSEPFPFKGSLPKWAPIVAIGNHQSTAQHFPPPPRKSRQPEDFRGPSLRMLPLQSPFWAWVKTKAPPGVGPPVLVRGSIYPAASVKILPRDVGTEQLFAP